MAFEDGLEGVQAGGRPEPPAGGDQEALDSTGLFVSYASQYFQWRGNRERGLRGWLKWAMALWIGPQLLLSQHVRPGPRGDFSDLVPLAETAYTVHPYDQLLADAGYDSEANHRFCRETLKVDSLIPAKLRKSKTVVAKTPYRQEMCQRLCEPGDEAAQQAYGQRWKAETVMSVTKRKWGESLKARKDETQRTVALLRGLVYNLHRLRCRVSFQPVRRSRHQWSFTHLPLARQSFSTEQK